MEQRVTFSALSRLWDVEVYFAEKVGRLLHAMGLIRLESATDDDGEPINALYTRGRFLKYCCRLAEVLKQKEKWHMRLHHIQRGSRWLK